jgi:hypothetical protein
MSLLCSSEPAGHHMSQKPKRCEQKRVSGAVIRDISRVLHADLDIYIVVKGDEDHFMAPLSDGQYGGSGKQVEALGPSQFQTPPQRTARRPRPR